MLPGPAERAFLLLLVPGLILLTIWAVIAPVIVVERSGVMDSFGRSRELVRGNGWQVFGVIFVVFLRGWDRGWDRDAGGAIAADPTRGATHRSGLIRVTSARRDWLTSQRVRMPGP